MKNNHIGQSFDSFLKKENIEISEDEIRERVNNILKDSCMDFLQKKIEPTNESYLKEQIEDVLKEAYDKGMMIPNWKVKRTKLPRKLKKKYKKEQRVCFDIEYRQPQIFEFTIPVEESEDENER